ncbi:DUF4124 domain-containing protein [Niveibacterium sp. 24ML]|uniref:DUF4124 domain-containing protein n=1 Tax=Niveibacterium sp. 24ML TaxID=2985512 RepID=UPI00227221B8|nr:DUF4124 domain-containing protein [Niveibacterium sp. 24ML]MCX9156293.1 DUF4124 domain-containing protein [Niveibacterium sp. 24ML]
MPHAHPFRTALIAASALLLGAPASAAVYKCADAQGKLTYSGTPCSGPEQREQALKLAPPTRGASLAKQDAGTAGDEGGRAAAGPQAEKYCPSERDIANLETQASSNGLDDKARAFMLDEVRRARSCPREDTRYTREDWARIQNSIRDQNRSLERDRQAAREDVLRIHSVAGSPEERDRIEAEKQREALREAAAIRQTDTLRPAPAH